MQETYPGCCMSRHVNETMSVLGDWFTGYPIVQPVSTIQKILFSGESFKVGKNIDVHEI